MDLLPAGFKTGVFPTSVDQSASSHVAPIAYSPAQAVAALGVTRQTIRSPIERGELRRFHVGRCARIPRSDVLALVVVDDAS